MDLKKIDETKIDLSVAKKILRDGLKEEPKLADCILVFGCPSKKHRKERLQKAVSLYKQGFSKKILVSGGKVKEEIEGLAMQKELLEYGISSSDILVEKESLNTTQNIIASLYVLEKELHLGSIRHLLLVSDEYHMKRCILTAKHYLPSFISLSYVTTNIHLEDEADEILIKEAKKIVSYAKKGYIADQL